MDLSCKYPMDKNGPEWIQSIRNTIEHNIIMQISNGFNCLTQKVNTKVRFLLQLFVGAK